MKLKTGEKEWKRSRNFKSSRKLKQAISIEKFESNFAHLQAAVAGISENIYFSPWIFLSIPSTMVPSNESPPPLFCKRGIVEEVPHLHAVGRAWQSEVGRARRLSMAHTVGYGSRECSAPSPPPSFGGCCCTLACSWSCRTSINTQSLHLGWRHIALLYIKNQNIFYNPPTHTYTHTSTHTNTHIHTYTHI